MLDRLDPQHPNGSPPEVAEALRQGPRQVDPLAYRVSYRGRPVALKPKQFELLPHLMRNPNRVHPRAILLRVIGGDDASMDERTVDVWI